MKDEFLWKEPRDARKQQMKHPEQRFCLLEERQDAVSATLIVRGVDDVASDAFIQRACCMLSALVRHAADQQKQRHHEG
ncbi:hypothetical protein ACERK3_19430 [Phycisphaerales bacterium AB-hyl4]|uniref:Uncharacterized protein n=1 Tax=Natronomicrosphaera hydrolytica TaxID=3242702 RepID=A0ABV4UB78_9BACT